jgi:hypothetical protein
MISDNPIIGKFQHQGFKKDLLFKQDIIYKEGKKSCKACYRVNNYNIIERKDQSKKVPRIYYSAIGSTDQVIRDAMLRNQ